MSIFQLTPGQIEAVLLMFARIVAICFTAPVLSSNRVPLQLRAGISILLALVLQPVIVTELSQSPSLWVFALRIMQEAMVGLVLGYSANLVFQAVQMAGEIQDTQSGFGFAGVVDPNFGQSSAILGQMQMVLMWLIFMTVNGHHVVLQAIADSFTAIPLATYAYQTGMTAHMFTLAGTLMLIALRISAPVVGAVLLTDLALGMLQRTAPQLNLIAVGFQVKIAVAIVVVVVALPFILGLQRDLVPMMHSIIEQTFFLGR